MRIGTTSFVLILGIVVSVAPASGMEDPIYDILELPADVDASNVAHNLTELRLLYEADPTGELPRISEAGATIHHFAGAVKEKLFCETTPKVSPMYQHINLNAEWLEYIGTHWCCQESYGKNCQLMSVMSSAGTDICAKTNTCVRCAWAAKANRMIASKCKKGVWAGGYVR
jgi:hypothetical protein